MLEVELQSSRIVAVIVKLHLDLRGEMSRVGSMANDTKLSSKRRAKIFADLTACLERAHEHAVVGQNSAISDVELAAAIDALAASLIEAQRLLSVGRTIAEQRSA